MLRALSLLSAALALGGCATPVPPTDAPVADVLKAWGPPTASYDMPDAGRRLEYASGPYGRTTWMVDLNPAGRVVQTRQVLAEAEFYRMQSGPALSRDGLLRWIGTPGERRGARGGGETWSWRYPTNDCLWFQVSIGADGMVQGGAFNIDPRCDAPSDARN